jgi:hypothetical protein
MVVDAGLGGIEALAADGRLRLSPRAVFNYLTNPASGGWKPDNEATAHNCVLWGTLVASNFRHAAQ